MLVLAIAVVASCVPLGGESVLPKEAPDLGRRAEAGESLISKLDRPPKQVHFSVKLVVLSDKDAEKVRKHFAPDRPITGKVGSERTQAGHTLGCLDFTKLAAFLEFIRRQTPGSILQGPRVIALDHEEATIDVGELFRYLESFRMVTETIGPAEPKHPPFSPDMHVLVIPHVTGRDNNVILTVIPKTEPPKSAELFQVFEGGPLGQLKLPRTFRRTVVTKGMLHDRDTAMRPFRRVAVTKIMVRERDTAMLSGLRGQWRGEKVNVSVLITPTVIDFERKVIRDSMKRAREQLGRGFSLEAEGAPSKGGTGR